MKQRHLRGLFGIALTATLVSGCNSPSPFADSFKTAEHSDVGSTNTNPRYGDSARAGSSQSHDELPVLDDDATLQDYLRYAALSNPGLEAKFYDWKAAVEQLPQVRALPDPRFTYGYFLGEVETRVGPMQHTVSLAQTFPWFGKLQDREDAAARNANAAYQRFEAARLALFYNVEQAYNDLFFLKQSIDITAENIELLQQFERVARTRYRVATAGHPDIIRIQVDLGSMEDRLRRLNDLRIPYSARLNAALNRRSDADVPWPKSVAVHVVDVSTKVLHAEIQTRNPELIALQEEIERERIGSEIARKDGLPDLTVGVAYTAIGERDVAGLTESGDDAVLATLSINLPIWREKYDAGVRAAIARRLAVASRRSDTRNRLATELQEALFEHHDARRRIELYRDTLLPKAKESLQASLGGFEQGTSDFLDLIETQQTLLEFQLELERALVDRATSYARIEQLVGTSLSELISTSTTEDNAP